MYIVCSVNIFCIVYFSCYLMNYIDVFYPMSYQVKEEQYRWNYPVSYQVKEKLYRRCYPVSYQVKEELKTMLVI